MSKRPHNFNAGPAALPLDVLQQAQNDLLDFEASGMSILEMSHRGKVYDRVHHQAMADLKRILGLDGDSHEVLFMGGGASTQFSLVPMNLLSADGHADYLVTGRWSEMALREARKVGQANELWTSAASGHDRVPGPGDYTVAPSAAFLHYTSNNTVAGTQFPSVPDAGDVPLVCDMSSDLLSRPLPLERFGLIYAGAQKNLGPAGVTVVVIRRDLLARSPEKLGKTLSYARLAEKASMLNTPPVFAIYLVGLVVRHFLDAGGLAVIDEANRAKAELLYDFLDASGGFYRGHAQPGSRSLMNVTFRLPSPELEQRLIEEATAHGLIGLKGHRSVGGLRASLYNAVPRSSVLALVEFLRDFQQRSG